MLPDSQREALERALGAQYEIQRLLGTGGMGAVYLARERALERPVAIKVLPADMAGDAESRERFRREARTAARLTHPNIVPLHTFGDAEGMPYFVMGYVRGESLGARMRREGRLPADEVRRILGELADALDYAHRQGVVHRDIKPDNILLEDESGRPMLTDFGVAKARASGATLTEAGAVVGTPHYMSPEQAGGSRELDGRSDLYALGVMGYQMLSGRLPFDGESLRDIVVQQISQTPVRLAVLAPEIPGDLAGAVERCMAKDPAARYGDGRALRQALVESVETDDVLPRTLREVDNSWFWYRPFAAAGVTLLGTIAWAVRETPMRGPLVFAVLLYAGSSIVGPWLQAWIARRFGHHSPALIHRLAHRPPRWWPFWWPRAWRREGDVYERLPRLIKEVRRLRLLGLGVTFTLALTIIGILGLPQSTVRALEVLVPTLVLGQIGGALLPFFAAAWRIERWGKRLGLAADESAALVSRPTHDLAFWRRPKFAALLEGAPADPSLIAEPRSAADYVRAVADAAARLAGPMREVGADAVSAARQLVDSIESLDQELIQLARDANPVELHQVEQKLAALGDPAGDHDARRRMRALLVGQRDLLKGLAGQLAAATERRALMLDLLRTLWLQLASLRAEAAREALADATVSGKIRALCAEIGRQSAAGAEVRALTAPPD